MVSLTTSVQAARYYSKKIDCINGARYGTYDEYGSIFNEAEEPDVDEREQHVGDVQDDNEPMPVAEEEQDLEAIALKQAER